MEQVGQPAAAGLYVAGTSEFNDTGRANYTLLCFPPFLTISLSLSLYLSEYTYIHLFFLNNINILQK